MTAHKGAQRLAVVGLSLGAAYWVAVLRWSRYQAPSLASQEKTAHTPAFFTDAGWDVMEPVTWATGFGALLASCAFLVYHNREVSYSSLLDLSITARQQRLYDQHGLNIERWTEMGESQNQASMWTMTDCPSVRGQDAPERNRAHSRRLRY